mgnify:CR=1 FL=1
MASIEMDFPRNSSQRLDALPLLCFQILVSDEYLYIYIDPHIYSKEYIDTLLMCW